MMFFKTMRLRFAGQMKRKFIELVDKCIPKSKLKRANSPPWIDGEVIHSINKRDSLKRKAAKEKSNVNLWEKVKQSRKQTKYLIREKFNEYVVRFTSAASCGKSSKIWLFFKSKTKKGSIPGLVEFSGRKCNTAVGKAEAFNNYFNCFNVSETKSNNFYKSFSALYQ